MNTKYRRTFSLSRGIFPRVIVLIVLFGFCSIRLGALGGPFWEEVNKQIKQKTGINPAKPIPKVSVHDINDEIKKKFGVDPKTPLGKAGDNWLFQGWKPLREPLLPGERLADKAMSVAAEGQKWAVLFLESMLWNRHWPDGFPKQTISPLSNPSVELSIQKTTINAAMALYKDEIISLAGSDFLEVGAVTVKLDATRNVYVIDVSGGKLVYKFIRENSFHVKGATFEAIPVIGSRDGRTFLSIKARCVYLDIEDCPGEIDRFAAHAITEAVEGRNDGVVAAVDLSNSLADPIELRTRSDKVGIPRLEHATVFVRGEAIVAQVAFDLFKQQRPANPKVLIVPNPKKG